MDEKAKQEARRRKILDNAEARLRYIKEGIPWRTPAVVQNETPSPECNVTKENSPVKLIETDDCDNSTVNTEPFRTENAVINSTLDNLVEDRLNDLSEERLFNLNNSDNFKQKAQTTSDAFKNCETSLPEQKSPSEENQLNDSQSIPSNLLNLEHNDIIIDDILNDQHHNEPSALDQFKLKTNTANPLTDPFKTLETLLSESLNERRAHKQKNLDQNRNVWISCFGMLLLGFLVRISFTVGLAWTFNEMMLVPFVTLATPRLISVMQDPPAPSSSLVQVLIMSGIKLKVISRGLVVVTILRTLLQLFSVYLVSFLLTHQLVQSFFNV